MRAFSSQPLRYLWRGAAVLGVGLAAGVMDSGAESTLPLGSRQAVCFPPAAPVFGDAIPDDPQAARAGQFMWYAPESLADYVNEMFYPALSTRLMARSLSARLTERLEAHRAQRNRLVNELADQLLTLQGADESTRRTELRAFAEQHDPRILAMEREAEELRRDLVDGNLLHWSVDWNRRRDWRIGETRFANDQMEKEAHFQAVRAAAYYEDGFSIEQRGLLLELAAELRLRARAARPIPAPRIGDPAAMFFSPATARVRLPKNATPRLVSLIGRFNRAKVDLKQELRDAVFEYDRASREARTAAFAALAERQWPQLVELEKLADEIREEMATIPPPQLRPGPQIPVALMQQIEAYNRDRLRFIEDFEQTLQAASELHRVTRSVRPQNEKERRELARVLAEDRVTFRARVAQRFQEETRERFEEMRRRYLVIQEQLKLVAAGQFDSETGKPLTAESLLRGYNAAAERFDAFGREEVIYRGYRLAMLMPGLSSAQRRLLFGMALVGLAQPLPVGEAMPSGPQPMPRS